MVAIDWQPQQVATLLHVGESAQHFVCGAGPYVPGGQQGVPRDHLLRKIQSEAAFLVNNGLPIVEGCLGIS